jgi:ligand-binding sensor domain-containing protein/serine phosphatase RsbU (regulator of sigma subunit)
MIRIVSLICILLTSAGGFAQSFKFRHFGEQEGMGSRYVYTLNQDPMGRLLIGTSEGLYRYDGLRFTAYTTRDSLADNLIETSCNLQDGSTVFGHSNGDLTVYRNGKLEPVRLNGYFSSRITSIVQDTRGDVWVASQNNGILRFNKSWKPRHYIGDLEEFNIYSLARHADELWIGTDMGLLKALPGEDSNLATEFVDEIPVTNITDLSWADAGNLFVATEDAGIFRISIGDKNERIAAVTLQGGLLDQYYIRHIRSDDEGVLWLSTNSDGLIGLSDRTGVDFRRRTVYAEQGITGPQSVRTSFEDRENNLWIGTIGNGLARLEDNYFSTYTPALAEDPAVTSVLISGNLGFAGLKNRLMKLNHEGIPTGEYFSSADGLPASQVIAGYLDPSGVMWVGTFDQGLWRKGPADKKFKKFHLSDDFLNQKINALFGHENSIYVATDFGAYVLRDSQILMHLTIENGLSGNVVRSFFRDSAGRIWIATTTSEFTVIDHGGIHSHVSPVANSSFPVRSFTEDRNGKIWAGTEGIGILCVTCDSFKIFDKTDGLYSDFVYSIICDNKNRLWSGHRGALSVVETETARISIKSPAKTGEVSFSENAVSMTDRGEILFGTSTGLLRYDPSLDRVNSTPPIVSLDQIIISERIYSASDPISLKAGDYKLELLFSGISLVNAESVQYQYKLEGYDDQWSSATSDRKAVYNHLPPGNYVFHVKAFNEDGFESEEVRSLPILIARPFWQQWWFIVLSIILALGVIRYIMFRRERFLKQNQEYLKTELAARTREVVEQKELLEVKNKDITDSILYAQNIQRAVLPAPDELNRHFPESFVYYKPRDIVSGDFYWIEQIGSRVIIACADCTGHGVPGAFMSLIGSILMKEIAIDEQVQSPAQFLSRLHQRLCEVFRQQGRATALTDGMDVSVAEIDLETRHTRIASANRPVFIYRSGELTELRGDRSSIGGSGEYREISFSLTEVDFEPGDQLYLFTDGITDQFGGDKGKKLKRTGLRQALADQKDKPMAAQRSGIKQFFSSWRGHLAQIDDVLLIGIRF